MAEGLVNYTRLDDPDERRASRPRAGPISPDDEIRVVDDDPDERDVAAGRGRRSC